MHIITLFPNRIYIPPIHFILNHSKEVCWSIRKCNSLGRQILQESLIVLHIQAWVSYVNLTYREFSTTSNPNSLSLRHQDPSSFWRRSYTWPLFWIHLTYQPSSWNKYNTVNNYHLMSIFVRGPMPTFSYVFPFHPSSGVKKLLLTTIIEVSEVWFREVKKPSSKWVEPHFGAESVWTQRLWRNYTCIYTLCVHAHNCVPIQRIKKKKKTYPRFYGTSDSPNLRPEFILQS